METQTMKHIHPINEVVAALVADKYLKDDKFAQAMDDNPQEILSRMLPETESVKIRFHTVRNTKKALHVVIPNYAALSSQNAKSVLSDQDLANIAGGEILGFFSLVAGFFGITAAVAGSTAGAIVAGGMIVGGATGVAAGAVGAAAVGIGVGVGL